MSTLSINLHYRPLRIGWCVSAGDVAAIRQAMKLSFALWGGRYNPIICVDDDAHAVALVKLFRVDALKVLSDTDAARAFVERHRHLPWPLFNEELFVGEGNDRRCQVVDLHHPIAKLYDETIGRGPELATPLQIHEWDAADPLADAFLATYGDSPSVATAGTDYRGIARTNIFGQPVRIGLGAEIPLFDRAAMTFASLNRAYVERHDAVQNYWDHPGFFVGRADDPADLIEYWNLRACDIPLMFYDDRFEERSRQFRNSWIDECRRMPRAGHDEGSVALWHRRDRPVVDEAAFGPQRTICKVDHHLWNGSNVQAPIMYFGETKSLGSLSEASGRTTLSFLLSDRPFFKHFSLDQQNYVLSVDPGIGLFRNDQATFHLPFIPELNEFYGRNCHFEWDSARAEPASLGVVTTAGDTDMSLRAIEVGKLVAEVFATVGIQAKPSDAGRVGSALIRQMGGLDDCRAFRIDGVRHLIASHSPEQSFSLNVAKQMISRGVDRRLADYQRLYIEPRPNGASLTDDDVFRHLLEKGVFRAGLEFQCPNCVLSFWCSLDDAKSQLECEYCGHRFAAARQLPKKDWAFRRSGLFGRNDHQKGGIPVALALQQLVKISSFDHPVFSTGMNLEPQDAAIRSCETDFVVLSQRGRAPRIQVVIGEAKSRRDRITADDIAKLSAVADAFPLGQFDVFLCFARLTPFEADEVALIRGVNAGHRMRAIMLTARELEPYFIYERTAQEFDIERTAVSFEDLARATDRVFFQNLVRAPEEPRGGADA